jgi:hypothetical protein
LAGEAIRAQRDVIAEKAVDVDDGFVRAGEGSIDGLDLFQIQHRVARVGRGGDGVTAAGQRARAREGADNLRQELAGGSA